MTNPTIKAIERLRCMCGADDRLCSHCGHPFEVERDHGRLDDVAPVQHHCPRCGQPSARADQITRAKAAALRVERGLIP